MRPLNDVLNAPAGPLVEEAIRLLDGLPFDAEQGGSREGECFTVRVTPGWHDRQWALAVACYSHGHRLLDWNRLRIGIVPQGQSEPLTLLPLFNPRGHTRLAGLAAGAYALVAYHRVPSLFRQATTAQPDHRQVQQAAVLHRTVGGQTVWSYAPNAEPQSTAAPGGSAVLVDRLLPVLNIAGIERSLSPEPNGLRVTAKAAQAAERKRITELCLATVGAHPEDLTIWQRQNRGGEPSAMRLSGIWTAGPDAALEILYRALG